MAGRVTGLTDCELKDAMAFVAGKTIQQLKAEIAAADLMIRTRLFARNCGQLPTTEDEVCKPDTFCPLF